MPRVVSVESLSKSKSSPYDIVIGDNILSDAGTIIASRLGKRTCLIITDDTVGGFYQKRLEAILAAAGHTMLPSVSVPAGERSKDFATLQSVLDRVLASNVDRKTLIVALGGGVIGDLAGLTASLVLRGLEIVQIPTTLLAQVDSSVGGKTGINSSAGKNTIGAFYQPRLVIADVAVLDPCRGVSCWRVMPKWSNTGSSMSPAFSPGARRIAENYWLATARRRSMP